MEIRLADNSNFRPDSLRELNGGRLVIDSFHVSEECRRRGIGRALPEAADEPFNLQMECPIG